MERGGGEGREEKGGRRRKRRWRKGVGGGGRKKGWQRELNHALSLLHVDVPVHVYVHIHMYLNTIRPRDKAMQGNYTCMRVASFFHSYLRRDWNPRHVQCTYMYMYMYMYMHT